MSKNIEFRPFISEESLNEDSPQSAAKHIPEWFKKFHIFTNNDKKFRIKPNGQHNLSIKACPPFVDAMLSGYIISLRNDIFVEDNDGVKSVRWTWGEPDFISLHTPEQLPSELAPSECSDQPFKFSNIWSISLPKGYSALITHPLNRHDLPFITLSGIVDADSYNFPVSFPFFFKKDAEGIIPAGTPIAQIIPFKRESWTKKINPFDNKISVSQQAQTKSKIFKSYKSLNWSKKSFK